MKLGMSVRDVRGVLLDVHGVLYNSGAYKYGRNAIPGSVQAVQRLQAADIPVRVVSNGSGSPPQTMLQHLQMLGFDFNISQIFTPVPVCYKYLKAKQLRPYCLVHPNVFSYFADLHETEQPNCVLLGDAHQDLSYDNLNTCFQKLIGLDDPLLITLGGHGRYYKAVDGMKLDVGAYVNMFRYALDLQPHQIVSFGKPNESFFTAAINDMALQKHEVVMIGDDIVTDVGAAQTHGIPAIQVRTGKWMPEWETHASVKPTLIADNLAQAVDIVLGGR